ncbi:MAG TPA: trypsin-like peptidase domain-containing protein [Symbiobacteriaceae bacterium]
MDLWSTTLISALDKVRPAVVHVEARTPQSNQIAVGTGIVLDNYHIISSAQIVALGDVISVKTVDGKRRPATCIGIDPLYFLAVLKTNERLPVDPPTFAPDGTAPIGLYVFAVGCALGYEHTVANGVIASSDRTVYRPSQVRGTGNFPTDGLIITTAPIHPGNTGGPLVDLEGRIVGMNGLQWQGGLSLALQASVAARVASQIIDQGAAVHPWLGFSGEPEMIDQMWVNLFSLPIDRGVLVEYVAPEGPGQRAGLQERDMVLAVDGRQPVPQLGFIRKMLSVRRHGEKVPMTILRQGEVMQVEIAVEEIPRLTDPPDVEEESEHDEE